MGVGHHHVDSYLPLLSDFSQVELIGMSEEDSALAAQYSARYGLTNYSVKELLAKRLDAVVVCSANGEHAAQTIAAAEAGAHVLCEKPLAISVADAERMAAACKRRGVLLMPALPMRFSAVVRNTRAAIHQGTLGKLCGGSSTNQGQMPHRHRMWFIDPTLAGGGAMMDHIIHVADLLRWFTASEVVRLCAFSNAIMQPTPTTVETAALIMLHFADGSVFSLDASWSRPQHYPTWGGLSMRLVMSSGVLEIDPFSQNNVLYGREEQHVRYDPWGDNADAAMLLHFLNRVQRKEQNPYLSAADGIAAQRIIAAAYQSVQMGQVVSLS